jgi:hypothetical protein
VLSFRQIKARGNGNFKSVTGRSVTLSGHRQRVALLTKGTPSLQRADPEIIFASWCGKPVQSAEIAARPGWENLTAVRNKAIYEIPGDEILRPGFRLVYGYERIKTFMN